MRVNGDNIADWLLVSVCRQRPLPALISA